MTWTTLADIGFGLLAWQTLILALTLTLALTLDRLAYMDSWLKMTLTILADIGFRLLAWQTLTGA